MGGEGWEEDGNVLWEGLREEGGKWISITSASAIIFQKQISIGV